MDTHRRLSGFKRVFVASAVGTTCVFSMGGCDLGEFTATTTTTTTLDGREIVAYLVRSALLTPIDNAITNGVNAFFDQFTDEE